MPGGESSSGFLFSGVSATVYEPLANSDREEFLELMTRAPEYNVVPLYNSRRFGMDEGDLPLNGHYFGRRETGRLNAAGAVYNLGSLFFYSEETRLMEGMAEYLLSVKRQPWFTQGRAGDIQVLLDEFRRLGGPEADVMESEWQVLRGSVPEAIDLVGARPAGPDDLPALVTLGLAMQRELFGSEGMGGESLAGILREQISEGGAFVAEDGGRIVSKAEATPARPHAALVGGVYTVPEERGRGRSTACVAALCKSMLSRVRVVGLSVEKENVAARRVYSRVGFQAADDWRVVNFKQPEPA